MFILYDDFGKITLKNVESMRVGILVDEETGETFEYTSSIDNGSANVIKLIYSDEKSGNKIIMRQDIDNIKKWGVLQHFEQIKSPTGAAQRADALLKLYNQKTRKLTIKNALGDVRVHAGTSVAISLNLGDMIANNFMVVNMVKHTFKENEHLMELTLIGGEFIA